MAASDTDKIEATLRQLSTELGLEPRDLVELVVGVVQKMDARVTSDFAGSSHSLSTAEQDGREDRTAAARATSWIRVPGDRNSVTYPILTDLVLTTTEAAARLGMSRPYLVKLLESGQIPFHRVGRDRRIQLSDIDAYLQRREEAKSEFQVRAIAATAEDSASQSRSLAAPRA